MFFKKIRNIQARWVAEYVKENNGKPPEGYVGGRTFKNKEGKLPQGNYREYDVDARPSKDSGKTRNKERIVIDQDNGTVWYTDDHYDTFKKQE